MLVGMVCCLMFIFVAVISLYYFVMLNLFQHLTASLD